MWVQNFEQWFTGQIGPLEAFVMALLLGIVGLYLVAKWREYVLAGRRAEYDVDTFAAQMGEAGLNRELARAVYEYLQEVQMVPFPMLPGDALYEKLGMTAGDVEETVYDLLVRTGRVLLPGQLTSPPETLEELVRYIQTSPLAAKSITR